MILHVIFDLASRFFADTNIGTIRENGATRLNEVLYMIPTNQNIIEVCADQSRDSFAIHA